MKEKPPAKYPKLARLSEEQFKRPTGVKRPTFDQMIEILRAADKAPKALGGLKSKLRLEDRLLMALEYLREYRTYFHISQAPPQDQRPGGYWLPRLSKTRCANCELPQKRSKRQPLTKEDKQRNHILASERVTAEHVEL